MQWPKHGRVAARELGVLHSAGCGFGRSLQEPRLRVADWEEITL